jgi:hypothetical protein
MSHGLAVILIALFVAAVAGGAVWGWMRRARRDATPLVETGELPDGAHVRATFESLYVATTRHEEPLERIAAPGLGMRSRATVTVADEGVAVDLGGPMQFVLTPDRIVDVGQSTVAIDRVVEKDGLTRLAWRTDAGATVDSYFRPQDASARALAEAVAAILPDTQTDSQAESQTGPDA